MLHSNWLAKVGQLGTSRPRGRRNRFGGRLLTAVPVEVLEQRQVLSVNSVVTIGDQLGGGPDLANSERFGHAVTVVGDLDLDGVNDLAVGARGDVASGQGGIVHILFMNANGTVKSFTEIGSGVNGGPTLAQFDGFGDSIAALNDLDGDNVPDIAVGAKGDDTGGADRGAVYVLFLNSNGSVKSFNKLASGLGKTPTLANGDNFGHSITAIGDVDGDLKTDIAVGALYDSSVANKAGAIYILPLAADGSNGPSTKIASGVNGGPTLSAFDVFGSSVTSLGDVDGDGVNDLAVGAFEDATGGPTRGAVYVLLMNANETVKSSTKIAHNLNGGPSLNNIAQFGNSVAGLGDLDGDGVEDLAVGAVGDSTVGTFLGAVHILFLNADGTVRNSFRIARGLNGAPPISGNDGFATSLGFVGSVQGLPALAVGEPFGGDAGELYILRLDETDNQSPTVAVNGSSPTYVKNSEPVPVGALLTLDNPDTDQELQIPGGQVVISINTLVANKKGTQVFDTFNTSSLNSVGAVGTPQVVGGRVQVTVDLSDSATLTQIRDALRRVTFSTAKKGLKTATRNVRLQVFDKAGGASAVVTQTINVSKKPIQT